MDILFKEKLSNGTKTCLLKCFGPEVLDHPELIAAASAKKLIVEDLVEPVTLRDIALLLYFFGYIEDPVKWIGS